jgi:hypothetical protein
MPILHRYRDSQACYVRTKIKAVTITFQITAEGLERLLSAGVTPGQQFSRWLLLDLYRSGDAYTGGSGIAEGEPSQGFIQEELDFCNDPEPESLFPLCSGCGSLDDLHLAEVKTDKPYATILCARCRQDGRYLIDACVPLPLVTRNVLSRFLKLKGIDKIDATLHTYKISLDTEFSHKWEDLARKKPTQESLLPNGGPQGSLL